MGAQGLSDTSIIHLQHVIFSPSVMFQPTKAWPQTAGDKAAVASPCSSKNGGQRLEGRGRWAPIGQGPRAGAKAPSPPRPRRQAARCAPGTALLREEEAGD